MKRKVAGYIDERGKFRHFANDKDGLTARDFLMLVTVILFGISFVVGMLVILFNDKISPDFFTLLDISKPVFITVVTGVMGVQCADVISGAIVDKKNNDSKDEQEYNDDNMM